MKSKVIKRPDFLEFVSIFESLFGVWFESYWPIECDCMCFVWLTRFRPLSPTLATNEEIFRNPLKNPVTARYFAPVLLYFCSQPLSVVHERLRVGSVQCSIYFRAFVMTSSGRNFEHVTAPCVVFKVTRLFESASQHVLMAWRRCLLAAIERPAGICSAEHAKYFMNGLQVPLVSLQRRISAEVAFFAAAAENIRRRTYYVLHAYVQIARWNIAVHMPQGIFNYL